MKLLLGDLGDYLVIILVYLIKRFQENMSKNSFIRKREGK